MVCGATVMSLKQSLKGAKGAIERNDPQVALEFVEDALYYEKNNYFAYIFRGKAFQLLDTPEKAIEAFKKATTLEPENVLGWKGYFQSVCSRDNYEDFFQIFTKLVKLQHDQSLNFADTIKDAHNYLNRHRYKQNEPLYVLYLKNVLPGTTLGELAPGSFGDADSNFCKLIDILSRSEAETIDRMIQKEKLKLPRVLTQENRSYLDSIAWSVCKDSELGPLFDKFMNYCRDDDLRLRYEELRLKHKYSVLRVAPQKDALFAEIKQAIDDMVLVKTQSLFCWKLYFDWSDVPVLADLDKANLSYFLQHFLTDGLAKVLYAYLMSDISPWDAEKEFPELYKVKSKTNEDVEDDQETDHDTSPLKLPPSEILSLMLNGFVNCSDSVLANRIICNYYIHIREYREGSKRCREAIKLLADTQRTVGAQLVHTREDILCSLATIYTYYEAPKNYSRALQLYDKILETSPQHVKSFIGKGLILLEKGELSEALSLLENVKNTNPDNIDASVEYYWCLIKLGRFQEGRAGLEVAISKVSGQDVLSGETRAVIHWRIAKSLIDEQPQDGSRIESAHQHLLTSLKDAKSYAPTYTLLGYLYEEHFDDHVRAQKCFYKAFELDVAEITSAKYLVTDLTDKNQWSLAEILCKRIIDTERSRRMLLSNSYEDPDKSWPYRVLGCSALNDQEDANAIEWFQTALRMTAMDIECWIGLGEAYYNCGRFDAAAKVFRRALEMDESRWVVHYMLGLVICGMGEFVEGLERLNRAEELSENEECVLNAIYEFEIEYAQKLIGGGFFGQSIEATLRGLKTIKKAVALNPKSSKLWKAMGDAFRSFLVVQERTDQFPFDKVYLIFEEHKALICGTPETHNCGEYLSLAMTLYEDNEIVSAISYLLIASACGGLAILPKSSARALRSVAYFNLGVAFLEANTFNSNNECLKNATQVLKRAVKLESHNATYWVALGNAYSDSNLQLAQHCYIKASSLDNRDAEVWINLAALYLRHGDAELAQTAFVRAQSMSPQQSKSWLGNALSAQILNDNMKASSLFTHAYVVANGRIPLAQLMYGLSVVQKRVVVTGNSPQDIEAAQEMSVANFAMMKYLKFLPNDILGLELALLISERCQNFDFGVEVGTKLCQIYEKLYERNEDETSLVKYADTTAHVARLYLGKEDYEQALELARLALELGGAASTMSPATELSCHVVIGLCYFFQDKFSEAINELKIVLDNNGESKRITTLTAQVLYAYGSEETKQAALDQLFAYIEHQGSSLLVVLTLGALAISENYAEYLEPIKEELEALPLEEVVADSFRSIPRLLSAINTRLGSTSAQMVWRKAAMLFPHDFHVWMRLNSSMALAIAGLRETKITAHELANAHKSMNTLRHMQRAIILDPSKLALLQV